MPPDPPREQGPEGLATPTQINTTPTSKTVENTANGAVFAINLQIYLETSLLQWENVPKLPGAPDYYCKKLGTGQCMI